MHCSVEKPSMVEKEHVVMLIMVKCSSVMSRIRGKFKPMACENSSGALLLMSLYLTYRQRNVHEVRKIESDLGPRIQISDIFIEIEVVLRD